MTLRLGSWGSVFVGFLMGCLVGCANGDDLAGASSEVRTDRETEGMVDALYAKLAVEPGVYELSPPRQMTAQGFSAARKAKASEFCQREVEFGEYLENVKLSSETKESLRALNDTSRITDSLFCYGEDYSGYWYSADLYFRNGEALDYNRHN
jgi:hypothetical protein